MQNVDLTAILAAKEQRAALRNQLLRTYGIPVVSLSINMPGPVKTSESVRNLLQFSVRQFQAAAQANRLEIVTEQIFYPVTGPYALLAVKGDAEQCKRIAVAIESADEVARLLDLDVFDAAGTQISRDKLGLPLRSCYLCGEPAIACMRGATHAPSEIRREAERRLGLFEALRTQPWDKRVWDIAARATQAMLMEAACTPAPGLVDMVNAGAHDDMDFFSFLKSSAALSGTMLRCAAAGWEHRGDVADLLPVLRHIGLAGERDMFAATGGVNTQKGLLFLLGILTAAAALNLRQGLTTDERAVFAQTANISRGIVERELAPLRGQDRATLQTAGERLYVDHGIAGIRGELEAGLPSVRNQGLPCLRQALSAGLTLNDALVHSLLGLMTTVEDTTVVNRHGVAVLREVQREAEEIMTAGGMLSDIGREKLGALDESFIRRNISPGGSADMLAATYFIAFQRPD